MYTFYKMAIETLARFPHSSRYIEKLRNTVITPTDYTFKLADKTLLLDKILYPEPETIQ